MPDVVHEHRSAWLQIAALCVTKVVVLSIEHRTPAASFLARRRAPRPRRHDMIGSPCNSSDETQQETS
jgi:hypothetical protein